MAKAVATCACCECGKSFTVSKILASRAQANNWEEWAKSHIIQCDDCHTKEREEEKAAANAQYFVANKVCAGYGLNLQFCSKVIFYSNDWSFATRSQAEDRVHRIGQEHGVDVFDICTINTLDVRILKCLDKKECLVDRFKKDIEKIKTKQDLKKWVNLKEGSDAV